MITSDPPVARRLAALSAAAVAAIVLVGCGGSSSPGTTTTQKNATSEPSTTATAPPTTTAAQAPSKDADLRVARKAQLRLTDFPTGWEESDKNPETSQSPCQTVNSAKAATNARDRSHDFSKNNGATSVDSAVYVYADAATATHWFTEISSSATRSCFGDALGKELAQKAKGQGAKIGEITTGSLSIAPVGDERAAGRFTIPINVNGANLDVYLDLIFVRVDRGIAILTLQDTLTPFDQALAAKLTTAVVDRLKAGLGQSS